MHGLLATLTEFILCQAVTWCRGWDDAGFPLSVSVNVSAATMRDLSYPDLAAALCVSRGVCPTKVVFELTESSLASDATVLLDILTRLRLKGFRVSIDDFGTGYSSLDQLRRLPFNELKLDHRLVQDAAHNPRSRLILRTTWRWPRARHVDGCRGRGIGGRVDLVSTSVRPGSGF
jgi:EAL domain-containing protein (putative c-di-GMP-specific phosphodiesterase class I)